MLLLQFVCVCLHFFILVIAKLDFGTRPCLHHGPEWCKGDGSPRLLWHFHVKFNVNWQDCSNIAWQHSQDIAGHWSRHPNRCHRLTPVPRSYRCMLADRSQKWNHQNLPHAIRWWVQDLPLPPLSSFPWIPSASMTWQSTSLSTTPRKTHACPLQL